MMKWCLIVERNLLEAATMTLAFCSGCVPPFLREKETGASDGSGSSGRRGRWRADELGGSELNWWWFVNRLGWRRGGGCGVDRRFVSVSEMATATLSPADTEKLSKLTSAVAGLTQIRLVFLSAPHDLLF
nr:UDP-glucose pyrophosphorylase [Ipomoea batatas]